MDISKITNEQLEEFLDLGESVLGESNYQILVQEKEFRKQNQSLSTINQVIDDLNQTHNPYDRYQLLSSIKDAIKDKAMLNEYQFLHELVEQDCLSIYDTPTLDKLKKAITIYNEYGYDTEEIQQVYSQLAQNHNALVINKEINKINEGIESNDYEYVQHTLKNLIESIQQTGNDYLLESEPYQQMLDVYNQLGDSSIIESFNKVVSQL